MIKNFNEFNESKYQSDHELDRILDKIEAHGIDSITPQEKAYLDGESIDEPQYDGNYMDNNDLSVNNDKLDYQFKIFNAPDDDTHSTPVAGAVYDKRGQFMIDRHICDEVFPELLDIGLEDVAEGALEYTGNLSARELVQQLRKMGFYAVETNSPY